MLSLTSPLMKAHIQGFTLIEMLVTLALGAIVVTLAAPNLRGLVASNRSATGANALVGALNLARSAAVKRSLPVSICPRVSPSSSSCASAGSTSWSSGWIVFVDSGETGQIGTSDQIIRIFAPPNGGAAVSSPSGDSFFTFGPTGALDKPGTLSGSGATLTVTPRYCSGNSKHAITVYSQGLITAAAVSC